MTHLSILFLATFGAAFLASAPPGLLNVNAAKTSVEKGSSNGIMFGLGVAVMVMAQTYLAVRIAKYLSKNPDVVAWLMQIAVLVFGILAVFFFFKARKTTAGKHAFKAAKKRGSFTKGMVLAAINLLTVPYYSGLNGLFSAQGIMNYEVIDEIVFIFSAGSGTFLVMYLYAIYFNRKSFKKGRFAKNSNYILSALMVLLTVITLARIFYA
ncbi:Lysine exporter protein [Croceitalea dokdonensis DOKDO 023]|uniref:Lysine exporter protein n=1 Tax=Croceitalea dokdonensis DOKDO 023 TaxID=1300341 RepID=A0A0P7ALJ6_9FLAO|nr:LysE family transporter [Croceitalea dokdonensis]KPM32774.1 Lysine exporter protein [Croceitalea dokdonensis DOKDO 023]